MAQLKATSVITFLSVTDMEKAREFFSDFLGLTPVHDLDWATIWRGASGALLGAVDALRGSLPYSKPGGVLVSLTVPVLEPVYARLLADGRYPVSPIKKVSGIPLRSFFLKGPEGYDFEIQQFTDQTLRQIFEEGQV